MEKKKHCKSVSVLQIHIYGFGLTSVFQFCKDTFHLKQAAHLFNNPINQKWAVRCFLHEHRVWPSEASDRADRVSEQSIVGQRWPAVSCLFWFQSTWPLTPATARAAAVSLPASLTNNCCRLSAASLLADYCMMSHWLLMDCTCGGQLSNQNQVFVLTGKRKTEGSVCRNHPSFAGTHPSVFPLQTGV